MQGLTPGRIVHYVLNEGPSAGTHRPAIVVHVWGESGTCNLQVFTDSDEGAKYNDELLPVLWATSVAFDDGEKPGHTWHWIEQA
jgi:hypothetical protein